MSPDDIENWIAFIADVVLKYPAVKFCNVTAAIDGVQFAMSSGNIDAGTIKLYGIA